MTAILKENSFTDLKSIIDTLSPELSEKVLLTEKMLTRGVVQALKHQPFFSVGMYNMPILIANVGTGCTDGKKQWYDPTFVTNLSGGQVVFLLAHEVMHKYSMHHLRRGDRDPELWNKAGDYFINLQLWETIQEEIARRGKSCMEWIKGILYNKKYKGWSTEQIYKELETKQPPEEDGDGGGDGGGGGQSGGDGGGGGQSGGDDGLTNGGQLGDVIDCPVNSDAEKANEEEEIQVAINQAYNVAKARGLQPSFAEGMIDEFKKPKISWKDALRNLMQSLVKVDYTFATPNRKTWSQGIYLPDYVKENMGELVVAIDTSASVSEKETIQFMGEIFSISEELQPEKLHVVWCDTRVQKVDTYEMGDEFNPKSIVRGGGTDFDPVFKWVNEQDFNPMALVYLTDGECPMPDTKVDCPVFWAVTQERCVKDFTGDGVFHLPCEQ